MNDDKGLVYFLKKVKKYFFPTTYDKLQVKLLTDRTAFYKAFVHEGSTCIDVGANVGDRTALFLSLGAKVIAIEPQKSCIDILKNRFSNKIELIEKGVGSKNEVKDFFISSHNQTSSFNSNWINQLQENRFKDIAVVAKEAIEIVTLDSVITNFKPSFIKIDVEGFELEVLKGLTKPFGILSFEFANPESYNTTIICIEILKKNYNNLLFNYAILDDTFFQLGSWLSYNEFLDYTKTHDFKNASAGDIYVKLTE